MRTHLQLLTAVAVVVTTPIALVASAEDPLRIAQAEARETNAARDAEADTGAQGAPGDIDRREGSAAAARRDAAPPADSNIEEIIIRGGESAAMSDFEGADSVTGFDASDLEALGAQRSNIFLIVTNHIYIILMALIISTIKLTNFI